MPGNSNTSGTNGSVVPPARTACAFIPRFPVALQIRDDPSLEQVPFAVAPGQARRDRVTALSNRARAAGVKIGMTTVQALSACSELRLLSPRPGQAERAALELLEALQTVSPAVEPAGDAGSGLFYLDPRGLSRVHGDEPRLLSRVVDALKEVGFRQVRAAVAGTRFAAFAAVICGERNLTVVPDGEQREFLAPLPLELLPLSASDRERLHALGLKTIGDFAALPAPSVEVRYGAAGIHAHRLARGLSSDLLTRMPETELFEETFELELRVADRLLLMPILETLLGRLLLRLDGRGILLMVAEFLLDDDQVVEAAAEPAAPCTDPRTLLTLLALEIDRLRFSAPVVETSLRVVSATPKTREQGRLFARRQRDADRMRRTLARLQALFGKQALSHPGLRASHRPEARTVEDPAACVASPSAPYGSGNSGGSGGELVTSLRLFDPPRAARVRLESGRIHSFSFSGQESLRVRLRFGPRRISSGWWERPFDRDYFQIATADQGLYWLFRDRIANRWYVHGLFD